MNKTKFIFCVILASLTQYTRVLGQNNSPVADGKNIYIQLGSGYAFALLGQKIDQQGNILNGTVWGGKGGEQFNLKNASFTSGVPLVINFGLMFSRNVGVELDGNINLTPVSYVAKQTGYLVSSVNGPYDYVAERKDKNSVLLLPSLLLQSNPARFRVFIKTGIALPFNTGIRLNETYAYQSSGSGTTQSPGSIVRLDWNITNYFSVGFTTAVGIKYKLNNRLSFFAEASMLYLSISRKERNLTSVSVDNFSYPLSQYSGVQAYHYKKNGIEDGNGNEDALPQPFGNLGLKAGLSFSLTKHNTKNVNAR